jgi:peptide/nickel transport system substrate-binding protein
MMFHEPQDMAVYDLDKARDYLAQSQWPEGGFELDIVYLGSIKLEELASLVLLEGLQELGITLNLVPKTWSEMTEMCGSVETTPDLWVGLTVAPVPDPVFFFDGRYHSRAAGTWTACHQMAHAEVDRLIDDGRQEGYPNERARIYSEVQQKVAAIQPVVWWAQAGVPYAYATRLGGVDTAFSYARPTAPYLQDLYLMEE